MANIKISELDEKTTINNNDYFVVDDEVSTKKTKYSTIKNALVNMIYPVGSLYITSLSSFNPNTSFGGTWTLLASKLPIGKAVYGSGRTLAFTDNTTYGGTGAGSVYATKGGVTYFGNTPGVPSPGSGTGLIDGTWGVPTKEQIDAHATATEEWTGLQMDSIVAYVWKRES